MRTYDFIGIGLGPFNLGLACLAEPIDEIDGLFLEARDDFDWHSGMMLTDATLQVPFLADLVTMADPASPYSFLSFLKDTGRLYSFYIRESFFVLRSEYNQYCRWAAQRLSSVRFGQHVVAIEHDGEGYTVRTATGAQFRARRLVLGVGTTPYLPEFARELGGLVTHTADYLARKRELQQASSITLVGSGQSAAEVYADLLAGIDDHGYALNWVTRSPRFFPMEYTKLTLEMTSPEYTTYFQGLGPETRERLLREQKPLYKGISSDTINEIFDALYTREANGGTDTTLLTATTLTGARRSGDEIVLELHHMEQDEEFTMRTEALVLATGYRAQAPSFLTGIADRIRWDDRDRVIASPTYAVDTHGREIFVQNAEEHTHGFVAPDLGMAAYRNSVILAAMLGREAYPIEKRIAFQEFGVPDRFRTARGAR
ncbi:SidA/IucD/PvdA family monooxygenase [Hoyosella sp. G463]|uniref:L-lysine N6-monooxygenase MbtG n=1 Tax=Lolliginicoccus lacisalsi TaxID=2742202 RepID=A0A927J971_9ACTN|nr:SidA/IucD/PvdA family monooxygenase [Lolliginicoccus lacisalsi]MBD8504884.1 SidA/IucD/PvdA family monooxygenase [Lolliginicoccus lacisalsi]